MPKKNKNKKKRLKSAVIRGRGGFWQDAQSLYGRARDWSNGAGKRYMNLGRMALDTIIPGSGLAAKRITDMLGWGAYGSVSRNTLLAAPVPNMHATIDNGVRICHKEFIGDVKSSVAFENVQYKINPGIVTTFPWLSGVAGSFQTYEFMGLVFYFKSTSASALNSTNTALGVVAGATQYNVTEDAPMNKASFVNIAGAMDSKPNESMIFPVECDPSKLLFKNLKVRNSEPSDGLQFYDHATFNLATVGSQASAVVGELWVAYDVILRQPHPSSAFSGVQSAHYALLDPTKSYPLGTSAGAFNDFIGLQVIASPATVVFPAGFAGPFVITVRWKGSAAAVVPLTITYSNMAEVNWFAGGSAPGSYTPAPMTSSDTFTQSICVASVDPTAKGQVVFSGAESTLPLSITEAEMFVYPINPNASTFECKIRQEPRDEGYEMCVTNVSERTKMVLPGLDGQNCSAVSMNKFSSGKNALTAKTPLR